MVYTTDLLITYYSMMETSQNEEVASDASVSFSLSIRTSRPVSGNSITFGSLPRLQQNFTRPGSLGSRSSVTLVSDAEAHPEASATSHTSNDVPAALRNVTSVDLPHFQCEWTADDRILFSSLALAIWDLKNGSGSDLAQGLESEDYKLMTERDTHKRDFLDSFARTLSPLKNSGANEDAAAHVTAAMIREEPDSIVVYAAKNGGFDESGNRLAKYICNWLNDLPIRHQKCMTREASLLRQPLPIEESAVWKKMLLYNMRRYERYIGSKFQPPSKFMNTVDEIRNGRFKPKYLLSSKVDLQALRQVLLIDVLERSPRENVEMPPMANRLQSMDVVLFRAYRISTVWNSQLKSLSSSLSRDYSAVFVAIDNLSRLHRAFYDFLAFRKLYPSKKIRFSLVEHEVSHDVKMISKSQLWNILVSMIVDKNRPHKQELLTKLGKWSDNLKCRKHCEMQLFEFVQKLNYKQQTEVYGYIGTSKSPCWLCWYVLRFSLAHDSTSLDHDDAETYHHPAENKHQARPFRGFDCQPSHRKLYAGWQFPDVVVEDENVKVFKSITETMLKLLDLHAQVGRFTAETGTSLPDSPRFLPSHEAKQAWIDGTDGVGDISL
ncbi:hypothetical protein BJ170DRAFT_722803 [Xylariales sp. AK1849]|nr:hypothetical protein BJ170DRAFT_722803 [Xylariales sp. AK1849]